MPQRRAECSRTHTDAPNSERGGTPESTHEDSEGKPVGAVAAGLPGAKLGPDKDKPAERGKRG